MSLGFLVMLETFVKDDISVGIDSTQARRQRTEFDVQITARKRCSDQLCSGNVTRTDDTGDLIGLLWTVRTA